MIRRPPRSTLFPTRRSSDLQEVLPGEGRGLISLSESALLDRCRVWAPVRARSEEHTSELQSRRDLVCRLLLEKKKKRTRSRYSSLPASHDDQIDYINRTIIV